MLSSFDILLIAISILVMGWGFAGRHKRWMLGKEDEIQGQEKSSRFIEVVRYLLSHGRILENRTKGILHLCIFWGVLLPLTVIIISQFRVTLPTGIARGLSLLLDFAGLGAMISLVILIYLNLNQEKRPDVKKSLMHLHVLLAIMLTGFLVEGTRLAIVPENAFWSPVGFVFSTLLPDSPVFLKILTRIHFFLVLIFLACLPYSMMKHVVTATLNIFHQSNEPKDRIRVLDLDGDRLGAGRAQDFSWKQLLAVDACVQCLRCEQNCPATISEKALSPEKTIVRNIREHMEEAYSPTGKKADSEDTGTIQQTDKWSCTTCLSCSEACPVLVGPLEKVIDLRRSAVLTESNFPSEYKQIFKNLEIFGDNMGKGALLREGWISNIEINKLYEAEKETEFLFWLGCQGGLDDRNKSTTIAAVEILNRAGIRFGILGKKELCCGDPALRMGNEYLFQKLANANMECFKTYGVKKIVTFCPHCYNVFKKEYPQLGADLEVIYFLDLVQTLFDQGKLKVGSKTDESFTYHDPCYLGRYNSSYDGPRKILELILESPILEMPRSREKSFCCGAGGGNFWRGKAVGRRMEELRIEEALETKASGIITSCPFCDVMFDSAVKQKGLEYSFAVTNIIELLNKAT